MDCLGPDSPRKPLTFLLQSCYVYLLNLMVVLLSGLEQKPPHQLWGPGSSWMPLPWWSPLSLTNLWNGGHLSWLVNGHPVSALRRNHVDQLWFTSKKCQLVWNTMWTQCHWLWYFRPSASPEGLACSGSWRCWSNEKKQVVRCPPVIWGRLRGICNLSPSKCLHTLKLGVIMKMNCKTISSWGSFLLPISPP